MADVFISYARVDQPFVRRLHEALAGQGRETWVDWEGIPPSALWMSEVRSAIEGSDAFVFVVSPSSIESKVCREEVEHAAAANKRLVPIVRREVDALAVPETIAAHNWIFFRDQDDFGAAFASLMEAIETDQDWVRSHTRLLVRAKEWEAKGQPRSLALRGEDLKEAEAWLASTSGKEPAPTSLQTAFVVASRRAATSRLRLMFAGVGMALALSVVLSGVALVERGRALRQTGFAQVQEQTAEQQRSLAISRELAANALLELPVDPELSLLLGIRATETQPTPEGEQALRGALQSYPVRLVLRGHTQSVDSVDYSPDGEQILTGAWDHTARIWDSSTGEPLIVLRGHHGRIFDSAYSSDGTKIITASEDGTARIWDASTGLTLMTLRRPRGLSAIDRIVYGARLSPDASVAATGNGDGTVVLWNARTGRQTQVLKGHTDAVITVDFSQDGRWLVSASGDGTSRIWDLRTDRTAAILKERTGQPILSAMFSPDGSRVVTASWDRTVRIWDARSGVVIRTFHGFKDGVNIAAFSPDGNYVAAGGIDRTARVWDVNTGELVRILEGHLGQVNGLAFPPSGDYLATASADATVRIWDWGNPGTVFKGHKGPVLGASFSPDAGHVVTASQDHTARLWDASSGRATGIRLDHRRAVDTATFSPDGQRVVTASDDGTARVWNVLSGKQLLELHASRGEFWGATFSPDGSRILTFTGSTAAAHNGVPFESVAQLWDAERGNLLATIPSPNRTLFFDASFSVDGQRIITAGGEDGKARIFDARTGKQLLVLKADPLRLNAATFSPDGRSIITGGSDGVAKIWDASTGRQVNALTGSTEEVSDAQFSPDGNWVVTASGDTARVWDASSGKLIEVLKGHTAPLTTATFGPDSKHILTASMDHTARIATCDLCVSLSGLVSLAEARVSRDFTATERLKYGLS